MTRARNDSDTQTKIFRLSPKTVELLEEHQCALGASSLVEVVRRQAELVSMMIQAERRGEPINPNTLLDIAFPYREREKN